MERLINFIKRNKNICLLCIDAASIVLTLLSMILPIIISEYNGTILTEKEQVLWGVALCIFSIIAAITSIMIVKNICKAEEEARQRRMKEEIEMYKWYYDDDEL